MTSLRKITVYTDESGQDTEGLLFIVASVIIDTDDQDSIIKTILEIERKARKDKKWSRSSRKTQVRYIEILVKSAVLQQIFCYVSIYKNTKDYERNTGHHIAQVVEKHCSGRLYKATINVDRSNKKTLQRIVKEIRFHRVNARKIRAISEESHCLIRLADALCGVVRDKQNSKTLKLYTSFLKNVQVV